MTNRLQPWEKEFIASHALFADGIKSLEQCFDAFGTPDANQCLPVVGGVATGKTTLIRYFQNLHPSSEESRPIVVAPLIYEPSIVSTIDSISYHLGIPFIRAPRQALFHRLCITIKQLGVRVLAIDEFDRIFDFDNHERRNLQDLLKDIANGTGISLVLVSTHDLKELRTGSPLSGMLQAPLYLGPLYWKNLQHRQIFWEWLVNVQMQIAPLFIEPLNTGMALRIHFACGGAIGRAMRLIRDAMRVAGKNHGAKLTVDTFAEAYRRSIWYQPEFQVFEEKGFNPKTIENSDGTVSRRSDPSKPRRSTARLIDNSSLIQILEERRPRFDDAGRQVRATPPDARLFRRRPHREKAA